VGSIRDFVQILQLNSRPVLLEQPDTDALDLQNAAGRLCDGLKRSLKVPGDDGFAPRQFEQPGLMFLEQIEAPPFFSGNSFALCDVATGADDVGFISLAAGELSEGHFDVERLSGFLSADQFAAPISVKRQEGQMVSLDRDLLLRTVEYPPRLPDQFLNLKAIQGGVGRIHIGIQSVGIQNGKPFHT
jgi:hypothetical protein